MAIVFSACLRTVCIVPQLSHQFPLDLFSSPQFISVLLSFHQFEPNTPTQVEHKYQSVFYRILKWKILPSPYEANSLKIKLHLRTRPDPRSRREEVAFRYKREPDWISCFFRDESSVQSISSEQMETTESWQIERIHRKLSTRHGVW